MMTALHGHSSDSPTSNLLYMWALSLLCPVLSLNRITCSGLFSLRWLSDWLEFQCLLVCQRTDIVASSMPRISLRQERSRCTAFTFLTEETLLSFFLYQVVRSLSPRHPPPPPPPSPPPDDLLLHLKHALETSRVKRRVSSSGISRKEK